MMSFLFGALKFLPKLLIDFLLGKYKEKKQRKRTLDRFYLILADVRDRALDGLRTLEGEHNRRNDPAVRNGRRWGSYGPAATPFKIEFFSLRTLFEQQYEDFTPQQRNGITELLQLAEDYNEALSELKLEAGKNYDQYDWGFALATAASLASVVYLSSKLVDLRERFIIPRNDTAATSILKVLNGYGIHFYDVNIEDVT